jgi:hypothetical protein
MTHKRILALLCAPALLCAGLVLNLAMAPSAHAICTIADQEAGLCPPPGGGGGPTIPPTSPPTPPATLRPTYAGTIIAGGRSAQVMMSISGTASTVVASVRIGDGLHVDCHGDRAVGMVAFTMTGSRISTSPNGTSTYRFSKSGSTSVAGIGVDISMTTTPSLSASGDALGGPISLHADVPWPLGNCDANWSVSTRAI